MLRVFLAVIATLFAACATTIPTEYAGPDAGQVVVGIGAAKGIKYDNYSLFFRSLDGAVQSSDQRPTGRLIYYQDNRFVAQTRDYDTAAEDGVVLVASLPPGRYEVFNFQLAKVVGTTFTTLRSRKDFSIPFEIKPGKAVYLGNFQANAVRQDFRGTSIEVAAVFVVDSRFQTDVGLIRARSGTRPLLADVTDATPSVSAIANQFFVSPK